MSEEKIVLIRTMEDAAKARSQIPKLTLGYSVGILAFGMFALREYTNVWSAISITAAVQIFFMAFACLSLATRLIAILNMGTHYAREMFDGRSPDPEAASFQRGLKIPRFLYQYSPWIGVPCLILGLVATAVTIALIVGYHLWLQT